MMKDFGHGYKIETSGTADEMIAAMRTRAKAVAKVAEQNERQIQSMLDAGAVSCPCRIATDGHLESISIPKGLAQLDCLQRAVAEAPAKRGTIEIIGCGKYSWVVNDDGQLNGSKRNRVFPMFYGNIVLMLTHHIC